MIVVNKLSSFILFPMKCMKNVSVLHVLLLTFRCSTDDVPGIENLGEHPP